MGDLAVFRLEPGDPLQHPPVRQRHEAEHDGPSVGCDEMPSDEQGQFPSTFNPDHKVSFTPWKPASWAPCSINLLQLLQELGPTARPEKIERLDATYQDTLPRYDQTRTPIGECAIEFVLRKAAPGEEAGMPIRSIAQPSPDLRRHYQQYAADGRTLKEANRTHPPFTNTDEL